MRRIIKEASLALFRRNNYSLVLLLAIPFLTVLFNSCKEEGDVFPDSAKLNLTVYNDLGFVVSGAKIYIFDSQQTFEDFLATWDPSFVKDSAVSAAGGVTLLLQAEVEHWILINYFDPVRNVMLSNAGSNKIDKLEKSSVIDATINIGPVSGNVSFWTTNVNKLPINITFANMAQPGLIFSRSTAPTSPWDSNTVSVSMPAGVYNYFAVANNECIWTGSVSVSNGGFYPIELNPCIRGRINFVASSYNTVHGPISVVLDNNDNIGAITAGGGTYICGAGSEPGTTSSGSFITVTRDLNTYNYVAKTQDGACVWTGTVTITSDTCITISLPICP